MSNTNTTPLNPEAPKPAVSPGEILFRVRANPDGGMSAISAASAVTDEEIAALWQKCMWISVPNTAAEFRALFARETAVATAAHDDSTAWMRREIECLREANEILTARFDAATQRAEKAEAEIRELDRQAEITKQGVTVLAAERDRLKGELSESKALIRETFPFLRALLDISKLSPRSARMGESLAPLILRIQEHGR